MCGLNGIFVYGNPDALPDEAEVLAVREAMQTRGPDGHGIWRSRDRRCILAHRRLSIIDLSERAAQPMVSEDSKVAVVFNGEIYNFPELRAQLTLKGVRFRTSSDTEVLLHLYAQYGREMVQRLRGMFAFAIYDEERKGLFIARDAYGIKPLYISDDGQTVRFASQVKALLRSGAIRTDIEPAGLVGFYLLGSVPEPFTMYRSIRAVPAGSRLWFDFNGAHLPEQFASIASTLAPELDKHQNEVAETVRTALLDSVRAHLLADVEVGIFLSAGIDSGALLGLMRDAGQKQIRAITLAYNEYQGTSEDEVPLAKTVASYYNADHIIRRITRDEFQGDLPAILDKMDQPTIDGINTWFVAKAAKELGLKVALSGLGGDELLAGYPSFVDIPIWKKRFAAFANFPTLTSSLRRALSGVAPRIARNSPKLFSMFEHAHSWGGAYLLRRGVFLPHELEGFLDQEVLREGLEKLSIESRIAKCLDPDPGSDIGRVCAMESTFYMRNQLLRDADWAGMAHGIEIRVPLVDLTLLKSVSSVFRHLVPGMGKSMLADSPSRPLPAALKHRAKTGFGVPISSWIDSAASNTKASTPTVERKGITSRRWMQKVLEVQLGSPTINAPPQTVA